VVLDPVCDTQSEGGRGKKFLLIFGEGRRGHVRLGAGVNRLFVASGRGMSQYTAKEGKADRKKNLGVQGLVNDLRRNHGELIGPH